MTDTAATPIVYVDANPFIYFIDGAENVASRVRPFFELLASKPGTAATSELTLAEVLAKARPDTRRGFLNLIIWSKLIQLQPITRDILIDTADYRRVIRPDIKKVALPDAIHIVTAIQTRCRIFLSADEGLRVPADMMLLRPNETDLVRLTQELA